MSRLPYRTRAILAGVLAAALSLGTFALLFVGLADALQPAMIGADLAPLGNRLVLTGVLALCGWVLAHALWLGLAQRLLSLPALAAPGLLGVGALVASAGIVGFMLLGLPGILGITLLAGIIAGIIVPRRPRVREAIASSPDA